MIILIAIILIIFKNILSYLIIFTFRVLMHAALQLSRVRCDFQIDLDIFDKYCGIYCADINNFDFLNDIRNWNSARGYSTLFDEKRLIQQVAEFPDRYFLISILSENQALAHALAVKLVPESLYYYLSAIRPTSNISNGGDLLLQGLFQLAVEQKSDFIDLGSSEVASEINASLMFFKSRFSNDISNKVTWTRSFFYE